MRVPERRVTRRLRAALLGAAVFLACTPTAPCACPPATTTFVLFGNVVHADDQPAPRARLAAHAARDAGCSWATAEDELIMSNLADDAGAFRALLRSTFGPARRCVRIVAYAGEPGTSDSTVIDGLILSFKLDRPDSLGVLLRLP